MVQVCHAGWEEISAFDVEHGYHFVVKWAYTQRLFLDHCKAESQRRNTHAKELAQDHLMGESWPPSEYDTLDGLSAWGVWSNFVNPMLLVVHSLLEVDQSLPGRACSFEAWGSPRASELQAELAHILIHYRLIKGLCIPAIRPDARRQDLLSFNSEPLKVLVRPGSEHVIPEHDLGLGVIYSDVLADLLDELRVQGIRPGLFLEELAVLARCQIEHLISSNVDQGQLSQHLEVLIDHAAHQLQRFLLQRADRSVVVGLFSQVRESLSL